MASDSGEDWDGGFEAAERRVLEGSMAATPSARLRWLEEALRFAARMGALRDRGVPPPDGDALQADDASRRRS